MEFKWIKYGVKLVACCGVAWFCHACSTQTTVSGLEISDNVMTNAYDQVRYDGCFWKNDLWEDDWNEKKSRRNTLKYARVKIYPWQSFMAVATLGAWVPVYIEWELNGDKEK